MGTIRWQEVDTANQETQLPSRTPAQVPVPMEVREARANRFVSLQAGTTETELPPLPNSKVLRWQQEVLQHLQPVQADRVLLRPREYHR